MPGTQARRTLIPAVLPTLLLATTILLTSCDRQRDFQQRYLQFGTIIDVTLIGADENAANARFNEIDELLSERHRDWHGWRDGSLQRFNKALLATPGKAVPVPEVIRSLVVDSKKYHDLSGGLFNPALGKLIAAWGFHADEKPDYALIEQIKPDIPGMHDLILDDNKASTTHPHLQLDFGAIAKGLGVRQIADLLTRNGVDNFIINAGGDVYASGRKPDREWRVAIENPFEDGIIATLPLDSGLAIFTSGNYQRYQIDPNNQRRHHIIDPTSGEPSRWISAASVIHSDPVIADIAATTLMLTPVEQLADMARKLELERFLVITEERDMYLTADMSALLQWQTQNEFKQHLVDVATAGPDS
jgi:thiamine biosynthesis lipoprotein